MDSNETAEKIKRILAEKQVTESALKDFNEMLLSPTIKIGASNSNRLILLTIKETPEPRLAVEGLIMDAINSAQKRLDEINLKLSAIGALLG